MASRDHDGRVGGVPHGAPNDTASKAQTPQVYDRLLDVREAAALLGLKPSTLYQWAYKRRISVVKLFGPRGALRFRLSDVEKLIQDSLRPASRPYEPKD